MSFCSQSTLNRRNYNVLMGDTGLPPDPYFGQVTFLLQGNQLKDQSVFGINPTLSGLIVVNPDSNAAVGSSIQNLPSSAAFATYEHPTEFYDYTENFTIEAFIRWIGGTVGDGFAYPRSIAFEVERIGLPTQPLHYAGKINSANSITFGIVSAFGPTIPPTYSASASDRLHIAWVRNYAKPQIDALFINGRFAVTGNFGTVNSNKLHIGWRGLTTRSTFAAFDNVRITKGVARYAYSSTNAPSPGTFVFNPPTGVFPNF
jgi:hypothetical protein